YRARSDEPKHAGPLVLVELPRWRVGREAEVAAETLQLERRDRAAQAAPYRRAAGEGRVDERAIRRGALGRDERLAAARDAEHGRVGRGRRAERRGVEPPDDRELEPGAPVGAERRARADAD